MPDTAGNDTDLALAAEFPPAQHDAWLKLVDKLLDGVPFDKKLVSRTYDGLAIQPLYTKDDWTSDGDPSGFPGAAPFVRGNTAVGTRGGWDIRQLHAHPDAEIANKQILEDLERGVTSIALAVDPSAEDGVCVRSAADLDRALKGVLLDLAPVALEPSPVSAETAAMLHEVLAARKVRGDTFTGNFGFDPIGVLAATGTASGTTDALLATMADAAQRIGKAYPKARTLNVSTLPYHSAGCAEAQELGFVLAAATEYLRAMTKEGPKAGMSIDAACGQMAFTLAADADMFLTIAKVRALRRLWARVAEASGASQVTAPITARTAPRMMTQRDPWVNILRATIACFAAGVAGAEAVTVLPFDHALGLPQALARRVARNTQIILQEESGLANVIDPAGGAWLFEKLTEDVAQAAWKVFQTVEARGGMVKALMSGFVADEIGVVRTARMKNVARRKDALTGVSEFPHIDEAPVTGERADRAAIRKRVGNDAPAAQGSVNIPPLPQIRLGQEFETLRDAGDAYAAKMGARPKIFLACLGTIAEFTARATYAKNFFEAGGIAAVTGTGGTDVNAIAEDFRRVNAGLAVICGTDKLYQAHGVELAKALRAAGAAVTYLAGRGGDLEGQLKDAGIEGFIFMGCDVTAVLKDVHSKLEAA